jgi:uncharacterized membrane protein
MNRGVNNQLIFYDGSPRGRSFISNRVDGYPSTSMRRETNEEEKMRVIRNLNMLRDVGRRGPTATSTRFLPCFGVALVVLMLPSGPAQASLSFCNKQSNEITVAFAYSLKDAPGTSTGGDRATTTEGWWTINPGACLKVSEVDAKAVWLYDHVIAKNGRSNGNAMLCVKSHAGFKVDQHFKRDGEACAAGWNLRGFTRFEPNKTHFTINVD